MQGDCCLKNHLNQIQRRAAMTHSIQIVRDADTAHLNHWNQLCREPLTCFVQPKPYVFFFVAKTVHYICLILYDIF